MLCANEFGECMFFETISLPPIAFKPRHPETPRTTTKRPVGDHGLCRQASD